jgi:hypothetical protein
MVRRLFGTVKRVSLQAEKMSPTGHRLVSCYERYRFTTRKLHALFLRCLVPPPPLLMTCNGDDDWLYGLLVEGNR